MGKGAYLLLVLVGLHSTYSLINFQYQYISELRTWPKAQEYCRKVHTDLAIVENMSNMTSLLQTVSSHEGKMWIGLERISASQESWRWSGKNKTSSFQYWMSEKPDNYGKGENCAAIDMNSGGQWDDLSCELNLPFICLGVQQNKFVQVKFSLDEELPSRERTENILEQIKAKLILSGLSPDTRLTWRNQRDGKQIKAWPIKSSLH